MHFIPILTAHFNSSPIKIHFLIFLSFLIVRVRQSLWIPEYFLNQNWNRMNHFSLKIKYLLTYHLISVNLSYFGLIWVILGPSCYIENGISWSFLSTLKFVKIDALNIKHKVFDIFWIISHPRKKRNSVIFAAVNESR